MAKHWSEELGCRCGARFRSAVAEARHRHNFPALRRQPKVKGPKAGEYWVIQLGNDRTVVQIGSHITRVGLGGSDTFKVYPCGDEEGWPSNNVSKWIRRIRL